MSVLIDHVDLHRIAEDEDEPDRRRVMAVIELLDPATPMEASVWLAWPLSRVLTAMASARERGEIQDA